MLIKSNDRIFSIVALFCIYGLVALSLKQFPPVKKTRRRKNGEHSIFIIAAIVGDFNGSHHKKGAVVFRDWHHRSSIIAC